MPRNAGVNSLPQYQTKYSQAHRCYFGFGRCANLDAGHVRAPVKSHTLTALCRTTQSEQKYWHKIL